MRVDAVVLDAADDVATALRPLVKEAQATISRPGGTARLQVGEPIPAFHKLALNELAAGARMRKYGAVIGRLTAPVAAGDHVHVHNLESLMARAEGA